MKKTKRKGFRLTRRSSDEEIIRWTQTHDVFDRLEKGVSEVVENHDDLDEVLREAIFQHNTAQLNMRLPPAMKAVVSKLARHRTTDATTSLGYGSPNGWSRNSKLVDRTVRDRNARRVDADGWKTLQQRQGYAPEGLCWADGQRFQNSLPVRLRH